MVFIDHSITIAVDFGNSRSGFAYILHGEDVRRDVKSYRNWEGAAVPYDKNLTQILYDPNGKPISFGYCAPKDYSELIYTSSQISEYTLLKYFKMELQKSTNPDGIIRNEANGKEFVLVEVIADYLIYIKKIIEKVTGISLDTRRDTIRWCFTVPAIWTDDEKQQTKQACIMAGYIENMDVEEDDFLFVPEPEAAATYCLQELSRLQELELLQCNQLSNGETFLVCDAGGSSVDLTSYMLVKEGHDMKLKSITKGGGGPCGSSYLDKKFIKVMEEIFGVEFMNELTRQHPALFEELMSIWEKKKVEITSVSSQHYLQLPQDSPLKEFFTQNVDLPKGHFRYGRIILTTDLVQRIFKDIIKSIEDLVQEEVEMLRENFSDQSKEFNYIFVVGGFGESNVLQSAIAQKFNSPICKVITLFSPGAAIVKGAVILGLYPSPFVTRRMRRSYGVTAYKKFVQGFHDDKLKVKLKGKTDWYCKDCFDAFVEVNEEVRYGQIVEREYGVTSDNQESMVIELYMSPLPQTKYVTDKFVKKCGEVVIDMKGSSGMNRQVQVEMFFGRIGIEIHAIDLTSRKSYKASIDFDKHVVNVSAPPDQQASSSEQFHFIFVNDKSDSMGGNDARPTTSSGKYSDNRLGALFEACEMFLSVRDGSNDVVSCVMYDEDAHNCFITQPLSTSLVNKMSTYEPGGGKNYTNAMNNVASIISSTYTSYTPYKIVVLFMSDGEDDGEDDANSAIQITSNLVNSHSITLHTIQLGGSSDNDGLKRMAAEGRGQFKRASTNSTSSDGIYEQIANHPVAN